MQPSILNNSNNVTLTYKNRKLEDKNCDTSFSHIAMKNLQPFELKK